MSHSLNIFLNLDNSFAELLSENQVTCYLIDGHACVFIQPRFKGTSFVSGNQLQTCLRSILLVTFVILTIRWGSFSNMD